MRKLLMMILTVMAITLSVGATSLANADTVLFSSASEPRSMLFFGTALLVVGGILRRRLASQAH